MDFHGILAVPKAEKHPHPKFAQLPEIESFAKTDRERKLLSMCAGSEQPHRLSCCRREHPKTGWRFCRSFKDPEFHAEFQKLVSDEVSPLTPEELTKIIREMPRDPEVVEMLKKFSGVDPLPSR
jgi:hypothetical protein